MKEMEKELGASHGQFAYLSQGRTHYRLEGPEDGQLIVLCHGFAVFSYVYNDTIAGLVSRGYRVLAFDWYAHGYSASPNPNRFSYNVELFVRQFTDLLSHLKLDSAPFYLAGHSMGGLLSSVIASKYPHLIKKLVLICPAGTMVWKPNDSVYLSIIQGTHAILASPVGVPVVRLALTLGDWISTAHLRLTTSKRNLSYNSLSNIPKTLTTEREINGKALAPMESKRPHQSERFLRMIDMSIKGLCFQAKHNPYLPEALQKIVKDVDLFGKWDDTFAAVNQNDHKTLLMWGEDDEFVPYRNCTEYLVRLMPRCHVVAFREADHFVFLNRSDDFLNAMCSFLNEPDERISQESARKYSNINTFA
jgi:pimeloyl-ACP methyl ester carboxylesterase